MVRLTAVLLAAWLALLPTSAPAQTSDGGRVPDPRPGTTVLICQDGGWDYPSGGCARRGGSTGTRTVGDGGSVQSDATAFAIARPLPVTALCPTGFRGVQQTVAWQVDTNANTVICVQPHGDGFLVSDDGPR